MLVPLKNFLSLSPLLIGIIGLTPVTNAQVSPATPAQSEPVAEAQSENLSETFGRAFYRNTGDFFDAVSLSDQFEYIFGFESFPKGSYPENEVAEDAKLLDTIYRDALAEQVSSSPAIRTRDLDNPYDTSLRLNPSYLNSFELEGREIIIEQRLP